MRRRFALLLAVVLGLALPGCGLGTQYLIDAIDDATDGDGGGGGSGDNGESMGLAELALANEVYALVNVEREIQSLPALTFSDTMADVAYDHALDMDVRGFFDHVNPDGDGPGERLAARGLSYTVVAENIATGDLTAGGVMSVWMGSAEHRANILSPQVTQIGVGVHKTATGTWWVQVFRHP
jgi:uncharacterized protein YkwD